MYGQVNKGRLVFCARKKHPVFNAKSAKEKISMLNQSQAIGIKASQGIENCESHPSFLKLGINPNYQYVVDSYEFKLSILRDTNTWGFLPEVYLDENKSWLSKVDLGEFSAPYTIEALWNKNRAPMRLYRLILDEIISNF